MQCVSQNNLDDSLMRHVAQLTPLQLLSMYDEDISDAGTEAAAPSL